MRLLRIGFMSMVLSIAGAAISAPYTFADGLRIQPLSYKEKLDTGQKKQGYVDVTNPTGETLTAQFSVKAFRQADDNGSLTFVDDERIKSGITLDVQSVELQPKDVLRLFFVIDGAKLPTGDVFATIFAESTPKGKGTGSVVSARVGTLLMLTNDTPSSHDASIGKLSADMLQIGEGISLVTSLRNSAPEGEATGFFPKLQVRVGPYGDTTVDGPLVFAGRERDITYKDKGSYFGPLYLTARTGQSEKGRWVFAVTGYWRWLAPLLLVMSIMAVAGRSFLRRHKRKSTYKLRP